MSELVENIKKAALVLKDEGVSSVIKHVNHYVKAKQEGKLNSDACKDILFINGCDIQSLPHPHRYRVTNQKEQLETNGYTCDEIFYKNIDLDLVYRYRAFIVFRCVHTQKMEEFIKLAQSFHKIVFYDIDDLVFDTKYTDTIPFVQTMEPSKKEVYDQDVMRYGKLMSLCDVCITTTSALAREMKTYGKEVIVNRNATSLELMSLSNKASKKKDNLIHIGYFSGSITHNADFEMILPVIEEILNEYKNVRLHICGELTLPASLQNYADQIVVHPFMDYKELPNLIAQMDINLAPLTKSIFNEAKSEIKWMEASLVKVVTIASNFGAFKECIEHEKTGYLCSSLKEWKQYLSLLIENEEIRNQVGLDAYQTCKEQYVTIYNGMNFISKLEAYLPKSVCFAVIKVDISGGILVALRHASMLQDQGYDVSILSLYDDKKTCEFLGHTFPILPIENVNLKQTFDVAVATMWSTVSYVEAIPNAKNKYYLVQNFETDYYDFDNPLKIRSNLSYNVKSNIQYVTVSKWCQNWLRDTYRKPSVHIYNGIETKDFYSVERDWSGKIRILIEGDCQAAHKNVDESFRITNQLDKSKYEIWYMSYNAAPKEWYEVDKFLHKVPYKDVPNVYRQCHILLKTSLLESFSYPPLEMMTTGGCVVALANDGNIEYLKDGYNCLFYPHGDIQKGKDCIEKIADDEEVRNLLLKNGKETSIERDWKNIQPMVIDTYK